MLLWAGTRVFSALNRALNVAYDVDEAYNLWKRLLVQLAMLFSAGLLFTAALLIDFCRTFIKHLLRSFPNGSWSLVSGTSSTIVLERDFKIIGSPAPTAETMASAMSSALGQLASQIASSLSRVGPGELAPPLPGSPAHPRKQE